MKDIRTSLLDYKQGVLFLKCRMEIQALKITVSSNVRLKVCLALPLSWFLKIYPLGLLFHVTVCNLPEIFCCLVFVYCILDGEEDLL